MADSKRTTAAAAADEQTTIADAVEPGPAPDASEHDKASHAAREAELARQREVADAIAAAQTDELPKLGGPMLEPGLGS